MGSSPERKTKVCFKCKRRKPVATFRNDKSMRDGKRSYCRPCERVDMARYMREYHRRTRAKVLELFGNKCAHCGFSDHRALQIDHVNDDGWIERHKKFSSIVFLRRILKEGTEGYQLLCANCNWIKRYEVNEAQFNGR